MTTFLPSTLLKLKRLQFPRHLRTLETVCLRLLRDPDFNRAVVEFPVRHGKSTYCSWIFPAWYQMVHPDRDVILGTYESRFSQEFGYRVRGLVSEYGPPLTGVAVDREFRSRGHFRLASPHTGQFRTTSPGAGVAGKGAHLLVCDDLVKDAQKAASPVARQALQTWFNSELMTRLEPNGKVLVVMSRRHPADLTGSLLAQNDDLPERDRWHVVRFPAIGNDGAALWPERFPIGKLNDIRRGYEVAGQSYLWSSLFQQDPVGDSTTIEWADPRYWSDPATGWDIYFDDLPPDLPVAMRVLALDPSKGTNARTGDYAAFVDVRLDTKGTLWVNPALMRVPVEQLEDYAVELLRTRQFSGFVCETNGFQETILTNIVRKCRAKQIVTPLNGWVNETNKQVRIKMQLSALLHQRRVRVCRRSPQAGLFLNQLKEFPSASHDDGPDALALACEFIASCLGQSPHQPKRHTT